ncbi:MAG TPA: S8 family serine peptidase [Longimicrobium sp.]|nr:S8 family serine peptidase [Longimicrobium sp.]
MRLTRMLAVAVLAATAACSDQKTPVAAVPDDARILAAAQDGIEGAYIVVLKEGANPRSVAAIAGVNPRYVYTAALNGFAGRLNQGQLTALSHNPNVAYIEQDARVSVATTQTGATWGLDRIDQRNRPLNGTYTYTPTGAGVRAYILDTGILTAHTQFGGRATVGYDALGGNGQDCNGHGTHVAGTVGGVTYGVAKSVSLIAVRVLDCYGYGTWSGVIAGMDWVANNHVKPAVANMSLGGAAVQAVDDAVNRMHNAGVTVVVAAGNENQSACNVSPARAANAITVGATTSTDARASFSNWGSCLDIFAPGENITSAWVTVSGGGGGGGGGGDGTQPFIYTTNTNTISGTSMASPHVAGVAALYLQGNTTATPASVTSAIISNATTGVVTGAGTGSPNRLLYSIFPTSQPVSTVITGPSSISTAGTYTWQANPGGGNGTYVICWEYRVAGGTWQIVGSASSYSRTVSTSDPDFELRVAVTSLGVTVADTHLVDVIGGSVPAPTASISGPTSITATGTYTWQANAAGGNGSYAYTWEHRVQGGAWSVVGAGSAYSRSVSTSDADFELRVTVTSAGLTGSDTHLVDVVAPVPPPVANITGASTITTAGTYTWNANASGGNGSYTYSWAYRVQGGTWTVVGSGSSYSRGITSTSPDFELRVTVTSNGVSGSDTHLVDVNIPTGLSANITGPTYAYNGDYLTFYANASGGTGSYTYQWQYRTASGTTWSNVGTGSSYSRTAPLRSFYLRVTVTSGGVTATDEHYVKVEYIDQCGSNGQICP